MLNFFFLQLAKAGLILKPHLSHLVTTDMQVTKVTTTSKSVSVSGGAGSPERVNSRQVEVSCSFHNLEFQC